MNGTFKPGDIVVLKSGGPKMTVVYEGTPNSNHQQQEGNYQCVWFNSGLSMESAPFSENVIRLFDEDEDDPGPQVVF